MIIAAYNAADTVTETINSVLRQTRGDFEVIVVDDGSTDGTHLAVEQTTSDARVRLYRQPNSGPAAARNVAIANASGEYVSTIDSDDLWMPRYLELMVQALEQTADAGFSYTDAWALDEVTGRFRRATVMSPCAVTEPPAEPDAFLAALLSENFVYGSVTMRRDVLERVGGFDPSLSHAEDYELWLRIAAAGYPGVRVPGLPLAIMRDRATGLHREAQACLLGKRYALRRQLDAEELTPAARAAARAHLAAIEGELDDLVDRSSPRQLAHTVRRFVADATRPWRMRLRSRSRPPADVAAAFPELANGLLADRRTASRRARQ